MAKRKRTDNPNQGMLFEEGFLMRTHQQLTSNPDIALAELVANAWDAGASKVDITIAKNDEEEIFITIEDDGVGMALDEFQERWKTLAYNRLKKQGSVVRFPGDKKGVHRIAFGRNGVGRHGLLCFADSYTVTSKSSKTQEEFSYKVTLGSGDCPLSFEELKLSSPSMVSHGTRLEVKVERNFSERKRILQSLSRKFLYDTSFNIMVNGKSAGLEDLSNRIETEQFHVGNIILEMNILHAIGGIEPGIAFWQGGRLIGQPSWILGNESIADKRTRTGKGYAVIVRTDNLAEYIRDDWSGFRQEKLEELEPVFEAVKDKFVEYCRKNNAENYNTTREELKKEYSEELKASTSLVKYEFDTAIRDVLDAHPTASAATLKTVLDTVIKLGKKRGGAELLQKISSMDGDNVEKLNDILEEWTVQDIYVVLDEIDRRIRTIDTIAKLSLDPKTPELAVLHPLITEARWLFGPEFDSPEYTSNQWLSTTLKNILKKKDSDKLTEPKKRADLVVLADHTTISLTGIHHFESDPGGSALTDRVLFIELKRGGFELSRAERNQLTEYVEEIYSASPKKPISITAFLVGDTIAPNIGDTKICDDNAKVFIRTFAHLVDTGRARLFRLRASLHEHYENLPDCDLYRGLLPNFDP